MKEVRREATAIETIGITLNSLICKLPNCKPWNINSLTTKPVITRFIKYKIAVNNNVPIKRNVMKLHFIVRKLRIGQATSNPIPPANNVKNRYKNESGN